LIAIVLNVSQINTVYQTNGFYRSKDPTNSIKVLKEKDTKGNNPKNTKYSAYTQNSIQI